jgi:hypothetical protein
MKVFAIAFNKKTNKYGLVNQKLKVVLPLKYDEIYGRGESFEYTWYNANGRSQSIGRSGASPNIVDGKIKVKQRGVEKVIELNK